MSVAPAPVPTPAPVTPQPPVAPAPAPVAPAPAPVKAPMAETPKLTPEQQFQQKEMQKINDKISVYSSGEQLYNAIQ